MENRNRPTGLDDTSRCPAVPLCEVCGQTTDLAVATADTPLGVLCLTLCGQCAELGLAPRFAWSSVGLRVGLHAAHLGIDVDEMAAALERGKR